MTPWGKVCCLFGVHSLTQWRTVKRVPGIPPSGERHCRRKGCPYNEIRPARTRRAPNAADTIQGPGNG